jgi:hypothetical protein
MLEESKITDPVLMEKTKKQHLIKDLYQAYTHGQVGEYWKNGNWEHVQEWANGVDLMDFDTEIIFLDRELDNPI